MYLYMHTWKSITLLPVDKTATVFTKSKLTPEKMQKTVFYRCEQNFYTLVKISLFASIEKQKICPFWGIDLWALEKCTTRMENKSTQRLIFLSTVKKSKIPQSIQAYIYFLALTMIICHISQWAQVHLFNVYKIIQY